MKVLKPLWLLKQCEKIAVEKKKKKHEKITPFNYTIHRNCQQTAKKMFWVSFEIPLIFIQSFSSKQKKKLPFGKSLGINCIV